MENIESIVESETTPLEPVATEIPAEKTTPDISPESLIKQLGEFLSRFHLPFLNPVQVTSNSPIPSPEIVDQVSISEPVTKPQRSENINLVPELPSIEDSTPESIIEPEIITEETQTVDIE